MRKRPGAAGRVAQVLLRIGQVVVLIWLALPPDSMGATYATRTDALDAAQQIRRQGCGARAGVSAPLRQQATLDMAARNWSRGSSLRDAMLHSGYSATQSSAMHVSGDREAVTAALSTQLCAALRDPGLSDIGIFQRGNDTWVMLAAPFVAPPQSNAADVAERVLVLVNRARAGPRRCGSQSYVAAPPLQRAPALARAAAVHAQDMARRRYFSHEDPRGETPADRLREAGYAYRIVGENIALGPTTAEDVVQGWLASPGHCENIMDPRFTDAGLAYASDPGRSEVYWVQVFAAPR